MMDFGQISSLVDSFASINIADTARPNGFLKNIQMQYNQNIDQLQQLNTIYIDRLKYFKQSNRLGLCINTISDISNDQGIQQIIGIFKRIQQERIRAFQSNFNQKYSFNKQLYKPCDQYELEDQSGKIRLQFKNSKINPLDLPYGIVIRCQGKYRPKINKFIISDITFPKSALYQQLKIKSLKSKYILTVNEPSLNQLYKLKNYLSISDNQVSHNIEQLIIIGGLDHKNINQIRQFDRLISTIGIYVDTFIIPSTGDAKHHLFPLKPYHKCLLKATVQKNNVGLMSNPQYFKSERTRSNLEVLVSCGENLLNLKANCQQKNDIQLMKNIIKYGHICPSSTFSLPIDSYNFDPLIMKKIPHLMIHGKCQKFKQEVHKYQDFNGQIKVKLVALAQGDMALTSLSTNQLQTIQFLI